MSDNNKVKKKTSIGGQALIEGIMMRGPEKTSMAVRHISGEIKTEEWQTETDDRSKFWKAPFIRGIRNFIESMALGYKCLMKSAEMSGIEEEISENSGEDISKAEASQPAAIKGSDEVSEAVEAAEAEDSSDEKAESNLAAEGNTADKSEEKGGDAVTVIAAIIGGILGVALAVGLFMLLPTLLFNLIVRYIPALESRVWRAIFEGVVRIVLFVGYVALVSLMKDIKRVFMYHGAEHKTIFCYEKGLPLTVENVKAQPRLHPRCGTSFMIFMLLIGIIVSMFITVTQPFLRVLIKLFTIPLIVGIGYEMIKLAGRSDNIIVRILSKPGLWLQKITTKEPDEKMIEVAIIAMNMVIPDDPTKDEF